MALTVIVALCATIQYVSSVEDSLTEKSAWLGHQADGSLLFKPEAYDI